jgi:putative redox protein
MAVELDLIYDGDLRCTATHGPSGVTLQTEAPVDNGGTGGSFSPTDLVATALGACVMTVMGLVAKRHGLDLTGTKVHVVKEMVQTPHRRIGRLATSVEFRLALDEANRTRLENAARHCPVHQSLHESIDAPIEFRYPAG